MIGMGFSPMIIARDPCAGAPTFTSSNPTPTHTGDGNCSTTGVEWTTAVTINEALTASHKMQVRTSWVLDNVGPATPSYGSWTDVTFTGTSDDIVVEVGTGTTHTGTSPTVVGPDDYYFDMEMRIVPTSGSQVCDTDSTTQVMRDDVYGCQT